MPAEISEARYNRAQKKLDSDLENYMPVPESGCWLYLGRLHNAGYGETSILGKNMLMHRISYARHNGKMPVGNKVVRHACDVRSCINPEHLLLGKQADNMRDMGNRGRGHWQK